MKYIVEITDCGPLSFRAGRETTTATSLGYVPGTALFGGLATAHRLLRCNPTQFDAFFMNDEASFGNLYPAKFRDELQSDVWPVYPLPATARSCKRFGGFKFDERDSHRDPHHGVTDALIPWALFALNGQTDVRPLQSVKSCTCDEPMDAFDGFYRRDAFDGARIGTAKVERSLRTRTGISRATGAVEQGILYSREVLQAGTPFWGTLTVPDAQAEGFYAFCQETNESGLLRLGNNRARGFGKVTLRLVEPESEDTPDALAQRIGVFDAALREQAQRYDIATPHALYVPITLTSDAIVFDSLLRYRRTLATDYLEETWGLCNAEVVYQTNGTRRVMGWNELWRLPKPDDVALTMGSVFLLGFSEALNDTLVDGLLQMQTQGIGIRRREGFGRLVVANPFHWEVQGL